MSACTSILSHWTNPVAQNIQLRDEVAGHLRGYLADHAVEAVHKTDSGLTFCDDSDADSDDSGLGGVLHSTSAT